MTYRTPATALAVLLTAGAVALPLAPPTAPAAPCQTDTITLTGAPATMTITACPTPQE